jgi:hypothetical protein
MSVDVPYSATCNSQPLTFIDNEFVGAENTQATDYNYELTFQIEQSQASQLDGLDGHTQVKLKLLILSLIISLNFCLESR